MGVFLVGWYLWSAIRAKEIAVRAGAHACEKNNVQFLDQTVERRILKFRRDSRGNPGWYRSYHFEFATDGEFRYQGEVTMYGHRVHSIEMDPFPENLPPPLH